MILDAFSFTVIWFGGVITAIGLLLVVLPPPPLPPVPDTGDLTTVTLAVSDPVSPLSSVTVSSKTKARLLVLVLLVLLEKIVEGTINEGVTEWILLSVTLGPDICLHEYEVILPSKSLLALPSKNTKL